MHGLSWTWNSLSCVWFCYPMDLHGIFYARILEWVAFPFFRGSSKPRDRTQVSRIAWILYQLSHQGSQRILEWVAYSFSSRTSGPRNRTLPFSRGSSQPRDRTQISRIAGGFFTSWYTREARTILKPVVKEKNQFLQTIDIFGGVLERDVVIL